MASPAYAPRVVTEMVKLNVPIQAGLEFLEAEVFIQPDLPFAIVYYSLNGVRSEDGIRADLDKQIFLDPFEDTAVQQAATEGAPKVLEEIFAFFEKHPGI